MINLSFIKLKGNVKDNYLDSLKGFRNKDVNWDDLHKVLGNSKIQFSPYMFRNGCKTGVNCIRDKQDMVVLDIDDGLSIYKFQKMFSQYKYILGSTKSHQRTKKGLICDRFRVILPAINIPSDNDIYFRTMELLFPFSDGQVLTKTAAFLGNDEAIIIKNDGKKLDMFKVSELASQQIEQEKLEREAKKIDPDLLSNGYGFSVEMVKEQITREVVIDVLESIGVEFNSIGKCRLREDENTFSAKVYESGYVKDYGSDDMSGDVFHILMELEGMTFIEAVKYVRNYI